MKLVNDDILITVSRMKQLNTSDPVQYSQFSEYVKQIKRDNDKILGMIDHAIKFKKNNEV